MAGHSNSIEPRVDPERRILHLRFCGEFTLEDFLPFVGSIRSLDGYEPGMDAVYDYREASFLFSAADVQALRGQMQGQELDWGTNWRLAAVVSTDVMFGICRMMSTWFDDAPWDSAVFRSMEEADAWVGYPRR